MVITCLNFCTHRYGKIVFIDLKNRRGPPFAFVEFEDTRYSCQCICYCNKLNLDRYQGRRGRGLRKGRLRLRRVQAASGVSERWWWTNQAAIVLTLSQVVEAVLEEPEVCLEEVGGDHRLAGQILKFKVSRL